MSDANPWDILDAESAAAYEAFSAYLAMPRRERSLVAAYQRQTGVTEAQKASGQWFEWSRAHRWVERSRAWDAHQERSRREAHLEAQARALDDLEMSARALRAKAAQALKEIPVKKIGAYAIVQMFKVSGELDKMVREGRLDLSESQIETLPTDGYDVLDSLRANPGLAPLLVRIQGLGVDLEPDPGEHGEGAEPGEVDA